MEIALVICKYIMWTALGLGALYVGMVFATLWWANKIIKDE